MPDGDTDAARWISVLERLERLRPATVVPGHGAIGDGGLIGAVRESLTFTAERTATLRDGGRSLEQTVAELAAQLLAPPSRLGQPGMGRADDRAVLRVARDRSPMSVTVDSAEVGEVMAAA